MADLPYQLAARCDLYRAQVKLVIASSKRLHESGIITSAAELEYQAAVGAWNRFGDEHRREIGSESPPASLMADFEYHTQYVVKLSCERFAQPKSSGQESSNGKGKATAGTHGEKDDKDHDEEKGMEEVEEKNKQKDDLTSLENLSLGTASNNKND